MKRFNLLLVLGFAVLFSVKGNTQEVWTSRTSNSPETLPPNLYAVVASTSQSVAVGENGAVLSSPDGFTWAARNSGTNKILRAITWTSSQFFAVGDSGTILASPDGVVWAIKNSGTLDNLKCVFCTGNQFIVGGARGTILTSNNGNAWTEITSGTTASINAIIGNGTQLVAVGDLGTILTSPDGITWTLRPSGLVEPNIEEYRSVTWTGFQFVAVGGFGGVEQASASPDGVIWTSLKMLDGGGVLSVVWTGNQLVALSSTLRPDLTSVSTSLNGSHWQLITPSQRIYSPNFLTWTGTQFIIVGNRKAIYTSPQIASTGILSPASVHNSLSIRVSPATLAVTVPSDMLGEKIKVSIYNITGQRVMDRVEEKSLGQLSVPIQKMPMGRYLLEVSGSKRKLSKAFCLMQ